LGEGGQREEQEERKEASHVHDGAKFYHIQRRKAYRGGTQRNADPEKLETRSSRRRNHRERGENLRKQKENPARLLPREFCAGSLFTNRSSTGPNTGWQRRLRLNCRCHTIKMQPARYLGN